MSIDTHTFNQFCSTFFLVSILIRSMPIDTTQSINFSINFLFLLSIRREQDSTTSHFRVTRAQSDSISRRSNLCLYFSLMVLKDFCSCGLSVPCQVLCKFKNQKAEQALITVGKNTAANISFPFFYS